MTTTEERHYHDNRRISDIVPSTSSRGKNESLTTLKHCVDTNEMTKKVEEIVVPHKNIHSGDLAKTQIKMNVGSDLPPAAYPESRARFVSEERSSDKFVFPACPSSSSSSSPSSFPYSVQSLRENNSNLLKHEYNNGNGSMNLNDETKKMNFDQGLSHNEVEGQKSCHLHSGVKRCQWLGFRRLLLVTCLLAVLGTARCRPMSGRRQGNERQYKRLQTDVVKYLANFGYLQGPSSETHNLQSREELTKAIKALQKAGGLPQTGIADRRTAALITKPRCGNRDDFMHRGDGHGNTGSIARRQRIRRYAVATSKWPRTNLTFRFINYTPDMPERTTRRVIGHALRVWSDATPLTFTEVTDSKADIMIKFASKYHHDGYPFDGRGMVLAHAFFPGGGQGGDIHFDDDEPWSLNASTGVDLFMVAAHEFGHALGLAHSDDASALMYPWYMGFEGTFRLPRDDYKGIVALYGTGEKNRDLPDGVNLIPPSNRPRGRKPTYEVTPSVDPDKEKNKPADPCRVDTHIDALTMYRNEIFLFIGKYFWRLDSRKIVNKAIDIHKFWYGLPKDLEKIDAAFERPDKKMVMFAGDRYWVFNANQLLHGFASEGRPMTEFNIPADVKQIDAAFIWGYNNRTYLVSGDMYWKMNENNTFVEYDYPRNMGTWKGVPVPLDAAFKDAAGKTHFFKDHKYFEFYDMRMEVKNDFERRINKHWLNCPDVKEEEEKKQDQEEGGSQIRKASKVQMNSSSIQAHQKDATTKKSNSNNSNNQGFQLSMSTFEVVFFVACATQLSIFM